MVLVQVTMILLGFSRYMIGTKNFNTLCYQMSSQSVTMNFSFGLIHLEKLSFKYLFVPQAILSPFFRKLYTSCQWLFIHSSSSCRRVCFHLLNSPPFFCLGDSIALSIIHGNPSRKGPSSIVPLPFSSFLLQESSSRG